MHSRLNTCLVAGLTIMLVIRPAPVTGQELAEREFPKANATLKDGIKSPPNPALAPPRVSPASSNAGTLVVYIGTAPVQSVDVWAAYPDGSVAVVRAATYRIEWFSPGGSRSSTEPVPFTPISVTSGDRKRVVEEFKRTADAAMHLQRHTLTGLP